MARFTLAGGGTGVLNAITNWLASLNVGLRFSTVLTAILGTVRSAVNFVQSPSTLLVTEKPALKISQVQIDLSHTSYVVTGSNDTGNLQNWTNPTNLQGAENSVFATFGGSATLLVSGVLRGAMAAQPNRPANLVIDQVWLDFYGKAVGLPIVSDLVSGLTLRYRVGGITALEKTLQTINTGTADFSVTPLSFRIDDVANGVFNDGATPALSSALTWANIALLAPDWSAQVILGLVSTIFSADAVRLRVIAHDTWIPPAESLP